MQIAFSTVTTVRFSSFGDVSWNGFSWLNRDLRVRLSPTDGRGQNDCEVAVGNDSQSMTQLILANGLSGKSLKIWKAYKGALAVGDPYLVFDGICRRVQITPSVVVIPGTVEQIEKIVCPRKRINKSTGFNALLPDGTKITIGNTVLTLTRR